VPAAEPVKPVENTPAVPAEPSPKPIATEGANGQ
jgi:hypothetical protein